MTKRDKPCAVHAWYRYRCGGQEVRFCTVCKAEQVQVNGTWFYKIPKEKAEDE